MRDSGRTLFVRWKDDTEFALSHETLRRHCPCANCRDERDTAAENPFRVLRDPARADDNLRITRVQYVGRYAFRFTWSDGHDDGLFTFPFVRQLGERVRA